MPPKRIGAPVKNRKNSEAGRKPIQAKKRVADDGQDGVRKQAKKRNQPSKNGKDRTAGAGPDGVRKRAKTCNKSYLLGALNAAMTQVNGESYTTGGLAFVAVNAEKSLTEDDQTNSDPLNLSQTAMQVRNSNKAIRKQSTTNRNVTGSNALDDSDDDITQCPVAQGITQESAMVSDDFVGDFIESSQPTSTFLTARAATKTMKHSQPRNPVPVFSVTDNPLQGLSQPWKHATDREIPNDNNAPLDAFEDDALEEWGARQPRRLANKLPTAGDAANLCRPKRPVFETSTTNRQRFTEAPTTTKRSSQPRNLNVEFSVPTSVTNKSLSQPWMHAITRAIPDEDASPLDALDDVTLEEWGTHPPRCLALKHPTAGVTASLSHPKHPILNVSSTGSQRFIESAPTTTQKSSKPKNIDAEFSVRTDVPTNPPWKPAIEPDIPDEDTSPSKALEDDSQEELEARQPRSVAINLPTAGGAADLSRPRRPVSEISTTDRQRITVSPPVLEMPKDLHVSPDEALRQFDDSDIDDGDDDTYRSKYFKLLERYKKKSEAHKQIKRKCERQDLIIAEMKDLLVFANSETKKAQSDPNAKVIFTTDAEVAITLQQLEEINVASKTDVAFGQNMALFFYGAQKLQTMSVSGVATNRFKNAKPRPGISPKKLAFIYEKVQQRVASRVGANNLAQITTLAHATRINKGIAEKNR